jgi:hypothetical protein
MRQPHVMTDAKIPGGYDPGTEPGPLPRYLLRKIVGRQEPSRKRVYLASVT